MCAQLYREKKVREAEKEKKKRKIVLISESKEYSAKESQANKEIEKVVQNNDNIPKQEKEKAQPSWINSAFASIGSKSTEKKSKTE